MQAAGASFWGRSPMYHSTPAVTGDSGLISLTQLSLIGTDQASMVSPAVHRQLISVPRCVNFDVVGCLAVSMTTNMTISNLTGQLIHIHQKGLWLLENARRPIPKNITTSFPFLAFRVDKILDP